MSQAPTQIKFHRQSQCLELVFAGEHYQLSAEFLRVHSPSAEVKGHGPGQQVLQLDKHKVGITGIEPQGNYAIRLIFSDGHDSGIYTWAYLHELALNHEAYWADYLTRVEEYHSTKDVSPIKWVTPK